MTYRVTSADIPNSVDIEDGEQIECNTLTATLDVDANHVLIEHKQNGQTATYYCAVDTETLETSEIYMLTKKELQWLIDILPWVHACEDSYSTNK